jgi:2-dehydro-3-deoxygalactonokinase
VPCFIALDVGTTNTRGWLVSDDAVLAERRVRVGVRDTARERSNARLLAGLAEVIAGIERDGGCAASAIVASGMIGSSLGLLDVPHVDAPAGADDLARDLRPIDPGAPIDRQVWIVPGVRTPAGEGRSLRDVMRGEETLCIGALACGLLGPGDTLVSIGSHWKRIAIDKDGRVASSRTSLGGELVDAIKSTTVVAEAVPSEWPSKLARNALARGADLCHRVGLPRALFELRLDQLAARTDPEDRLAALVGAVIGADLKDWAAPPGDGRYVIAGGSAAADAWTGVLEARGYRVARIATEESERAQRAGLRQIAARAGILT